METTISLLPFIDPETNGFLLDLPVSDRGSTAHPFQILDEGQPFSTLVQAGLKVKGGASFKSVFILMQKDRYPAGSDCLSPMTNGDIDLAWQETFALYAARNDTFWIPGPVRAHELLPMVNPLFFCKQKHCFFHPPCPVCGRDLELCKDDNILKQAGLSPYFTSLNRYLFCPDCLGGRKKTAFYKYARSSNDPPFTRYREDLIMDFARLKSSRHFPCLNCPDHPECYLTGKKAVDRIGFFSFYPFYMLLFDGASIRAADFLFFISGRPLREIFTKCVTVNLRENIKCEDQTAFFFKGEPRFFLEVLFLKLSFMETLVTMLDTPPLAGAKSRIELSARSIWISLEAQGAMMPFFWNARVKFMDFISNPSTMPVAVSLGPNQNLNFIIRLWFYTFLVNKEQDASTVFLSLDKLTGILSGRRDLDHFFTDYDDMTRAVPEFAACNLFWDRDSFQVSDTFYEFWLKTLRAGAKLLCVPAGENATLVLGGLQQEIGQLKQAVKAQLFAVKTGFAPVMAPDQPICQDNVPFKTETKDASETERMAVAAILRQVKDKWLAETQDCPLAPDSNTAALMDKDPAQVSPQADPAEEDYLETIVLSSQDHPFQESDPVLPARDPASFDHFAAQLPGSSDFDDLEETVVLTGGPPDNEKKDAGGFDDLEKTMVISPKK